MRNLKKVFEDCKNKEEIDEKYAGFKKAGKSVGSGTKKGLKSVGSFLKRTWSDDSHM